MVLDALRRVLHPRAAEWDMCFHASPSQALRAAAENPFDVAVTDLCMPEMGGFDFLEKLKTLQGNDPPCIVLTGTGDLQTAMEAINRIGVFRFYSKPCRPEHLAEGVASALKQAELSRRQAAGAAHPALAALDKLPLAVIALDAEKRIIFMNRPGMELLRQGRGLTMSATGICRAVGTGATQDLYAAIDGVIAGKDVAALPLSLSDGEQPLALTATAAEAGESDAKVLLFVQDRKRAALPSADMLRGLFGLTAAEAKLAQGLARGMDIPQAALESGITVNSARTYLKSIFAKTDTNRQAELVRLLLASTIALAD